MKNVIAMTYGLAGRDAVMSLAGPTSRAVHLL